MSTELNKNEGTNALHTLPRVDGLTVGIVCAEWNDQITGALLQGALDLFAEQGYEDITIARVLGAAPDEFYEDQANVDGQGGIDIDDVTALITIVLGGH